MLENSLIACVDDDAAVAEAIEGLLKAFGFKVETFSSAESFLTSGALDNASCLITDVKLGGMSGLQLQTRLAEMGRQIPTIVITAFPEERLRQQAIDAGAVCFLGKPVTKMQLMGCVDLALERRSGEGVQ